MGFSQILTVLAADHLRPKGYRDVMEEVRIANGVLPMVECGEFARDVVTKRFPHAHQWYEHRYDALVQRLSKKGAWKASIALLKVEATGADEAKAVNALLTQTKLRRDEVSVRQGPPAD